MTTSSPVPDIQTSNAIVSVLIPLSAVLLEICVAVVSVILKCCKKIAPVPQVRYTRVIALVLTLTFSLPMVLKVVPDNNSSDQLLNAIGVGLQLGLATLVGMYVEGQASETRKNEEIESENVSGLALREINEDRRIAGEDSTV